MIHLALHLVVPAAVAALCYPGRRLTAWLVLVATMVVDLDHLLADPIYDPNRCSIGFHPLHGLLPIGLYALCSLHRKTRLIGIGLILHMLLDGGDCLVQFA